MVGWGCRLKPGFSVPVPARCERESCPERNPCPAHSDRWSLVEEGSTPAWAAAGWRGCRLGGGCDESAASPLIISTPRPLIAALHQAPDGSGCVREEGRCNSQVWRRVMRHTPEVNGASSPPLLYAGCASPLETGLFPVHARWCPRGSRKGALRDRVPPKARAAGPAVRTRTAPARRPSGQDAGPTRPIECCRGPRGGRSRWKSHRPSRPGPRRGARAAAGLRPLPGPFLPEHCPSFTTRAAQRGHQIPPFILDTLFPLDTFIVLFLFNKSLSEAWRHTHCVCRVLLPSQYICMYFIYVCSRCINIYNSVFVCSITYFFWPKLSFLHACFPH